MKRTQRLYCLILLVIIAFQGFGMESYRPDSAKYQVALPINLLGAISMGGGYYLSPKYKLQSNLYFYRGYPAVAFTKKNYSMEDPDGSFKGFGLKGVAQHNFMLASYKDGYFHLGTGLGFWKRNLRYNKSIVELNFGQEYKTQQSDVFYDLTCHIQAGANFYILGHLSTGVFLDVGYLRRFGSNSNDWTNLSPIPVLGLVNEKHLFASVQVELYWNIGKK